MERACPHSTFGFGRSEMGEGAVSIAIFVGGLDLVDVALPPAHHSGHEPRFIRKGEPHKLLGPGMR